MKGFLENLTEIYHLVNWWEKETKSYIFVDSYVNRFVVKIEPANLSYI